MLGALKASAADSGNLVTLVRRGGGGRGGHVGRGGGGRGGHIARGGIPLSTQWSYFHEFDVENRAEKDVGMLTVTVPLSIASH
jgi:hypothetical protein